MNKIDFEKKINKFHSKDVDKNYCFLCGKKITNKNKSTEDIFPLWIQKEFNLYNQRFNLLNKSSIPYRQMKINCCIKCNTIYLSNLEKKIINKFKNGFNHFKKINENDLALWLGKIMYGCLIKETTLLIEQKNKQNNNKILTKNQIQNLNLFKDLLSGIRKNFIVPDQIKPWSIYIVKTQKNTKKELNFDYLDNIISNTIAIRINDIGIIAIFFDNSAHKINYPNLPIKTKNKILTDIEFRELATMVIYKSTLFNKIPYYIYSKDRKNVNMCPIPVFSSPQKPIYNDWKDDEYNKFRSVYL